MADAAELKPWGRFRLVSKDPAAESDHIYFYRTETRIGRNPQRAHVVLNLLFVSGVHCIVKLDGEDESGEPIVRIQDLSRNGIYVNEVRVDATTGAEISANATIHFTKPGLAVKNIAPTIYRFEILRDGLTPENARLRVERDSSTARLLPAAGTPTQAKGTTAAVVTTQLLTGKKKRRSEGQAEDVSMLEEMEIEVTRTVSSTGAEASPSAKRRRTGDRSSGDEDHDNLLMTSSHLQQTNQGLRAKLSDAAERESKLKHEKGQLERERDNLKDQLQVLEEGRMLAQNEATLKGGLLDDREREIERLKELVDALTNQLDESKAEVASLRKNEEAREKLLSEIKAEREKQEMEMITMTNQLDTAQTKVRKSEEQLKSVYEEKRKLELAIDSVQTRTQLVEEDKRGSMEEQMLLKAKLKEMQKFFKDGEALMARGRRMAEDDQSIISAELEALQRSDQSTLYSSEQSQPAPTQENYIGDTQPDDGEDIEQTLDQDAAAARAGLLTMDGAVGPFAADQSKISLHQSISLDLDDQQPPISSFSTEISADDTPAEHTEGKSSNSESTLSSNSSSSKTPTAPPQPRSKLTAPPLALLEEVEESKGSKSDDEGENADVEDDADDDAEDTALPDEEEAEDDKENTPVAPKGDKVGEGASKTPQKPGQQGWLQMIVSNEEEKSEQASHSEGIFDDETQLSGGE